MSNYIKSNLGSRDWRCFEHRGDHPVILKKDEFMMRVLEWAAKDSDKVQINQDLMLQDMKGTEVQKEISVFDPKFHKCPLLRSEPATSNEISRDSNRPLSDLACSESLS